MYALRVLSLLLLMFISISLQALCLNILAEDLNSFNEVEVLIHILGKEHGLPEDFKCNIVRQYRYFDMILATCPTSEVSRLKQLGYSVFPNANVSVSWIRGELKILGFDARLNNAWYVNYTYTRYWSWAVSRVSADLVWKYLRVNGSNIVIAVLDTGIDPDHPLLRDKVIGWIEFDRRGIPVCSKPRDNVGHGTWVSSIIAGGDTERYLFGVAPGAKLLVANVLPGGFGTVAQVLAGLEWSLDPYDCENNKLGLKPHVVSMSFGIDVAHDYVEYMRVFLNPVSKLIEGGIALIASIGNNGPYTALSPGNIWGIIGVGSSDFNDNVAWFSSYDEIEYPKPPEKWPFKERYPNKYVKPDFIAPGVDVPGAWPGGLLLIGSGTSASAAIVSGVVALLYSVLLEKGLEGSQIVEAIYDILVESSIKSGVNGEGNGLIDAYYAVSKAMGLNVFRINVLISPDVTQPGFHARIMLPGVQKGVNVDVYVSGVMTYSGAYNEGGLDIYIPPTHRDGNLVTVVGHDNGIYGRGLIRILPLLLTTSSPYPGGRVEVFASGLGIGDEIAIYLEDNILSITRSDLRGTFSIYLIMPFVNEGYYKIKLIDRNRPYISIERRVYINPVIPETIPVAIYTEPYYIAGKDGLVDINIGFYKAILLEIVPIESNVSMVKVLGFERVYMTLYRARIYVERNLSREDIAILNAVISIGGRKYSFLFTIRLLPDDPFRLVVNTYRSDLEEVSRLYDMKISEINNTIDNKIAYLVNKLDSAITMSEEMVLRIDDVSKNMRDLYKLINDLQVSVNAIYIIAIASLMFSAISIIASAWISYRKHH